MMLAGRSLMTAFAIAGLAVTGAVALAAAAPGSREADSRIQNVAGWQIADAAAPSETDRRRRAINMVHEGAGWRIEYQANAGVEEVLPGSSYMVNVDAPDNGSCSFGNSADVGEGTPDERAYLVRQRIAESIVEAQRQCHRTADVSAAALAGFDQAFVAADRWTAERRAIFDRDPARLAAQAASDAANDAQPVEADDGSYAVANDSTAAEPK